MLRLLSIDVFLGKAVAWTWVIEFQKRGLPHAHILLIVVASAKPRTPADIDECLCAEISDSATQPGLPGFPTDELREVEVMCQRTRANFQGDASVRGKRLRVTLERGSSKSVHENALMLRQQDMD